MYKPLYDLFCPLCNHSLHVQGERTETFSQYVAYCKHCKCEFTVHYFKAVNYTDLNKRGGGNNVCG